MCMLNFPKTDSHPPESMESLKEFQSWVSITGNLVCLSSIKFIRKYHWILNLALEKRSSKTQKREDKICPVNFSARTFLNIDWSLSKLQKFIMTSWTGVIYLSYHANFFYLDMAHLWQKLIAVHRVKAGPKENSDWLKQLMAKRQLSMRILMMLQ